MPEPKKKTTRKRSTKPRSSTREKTRPESKSSESGERTAPFQLTLRPEFAGALSYLLGPVSGLFFLATDKRPEVRLHALQSITLSAATMLVAWLMLKSLIGILLLPPFLLGMFLVWLVAIWRTAIGIRWRIPLIYPFLKRLRVIP